MQGLHVAAEEARGRAAKSASARIPDARAVINDLRRLMDTGPIIVAVSV
jgi:hypothetical protein